MLDLFAVHRGKLVEGILGGVVLHVIAPLEVVFSVASILLYRSDDDNSSFW